MSSRCRILPALAVSLLTVGAPGRAAQQPSGPALPPPRPIPGITADDRFPRGCVDCHINYPDMKVDARFSSIMARWRKGVEPEVLAKAQATAPPGMKLKGVHPPVPATVQVPSGCMPCHGKASKVAPALGPLLHALHFSGGKENVFLTAFQGECTHCHKLDGRTGQWTMPSGQEK